MQEKPNVRLYDIWIFSPGQVYDVTRLFLFWEGCFSRTCQSLPTLATFSNDADQKAWAKSSNGMLWSDGKVGTSFERSHRGEYFSVHSIGIRSFKKKLNIRPEHPKHFEKLWNNWWILWKNLANFLETSVGTEILNWTCSCDFMANFHFSRSYEFEKCKNNVQNWSKIFI